MANLLNSVSNFNALLFFISLLSFQTVFGQRNQATSDSTAKDPYLQKLYWKLNDSPMQQKLRNLRPFPVGVVYYQQTDHNLDSIRQSFRIIKSLGFTALKQIDLKQPDLPNGFREKVFHAALDEGLYPWYYGNGGWANITVELLKSLKIKLPLSEKNMPAIQNHPEMISYQKAFMRKRIERMKDQPQKPREMGEPGRNTPYLTERLIPLFAKWLEAQYKTLDRLKNAWSYGYTISHEINSFEDAARHLQSTGVDQFGGRIGVSNWDIRSSRDAMRFQADLKIGDYKEFMQTYSAWDPDEPNRTGGHQLLENQALNGWDLEAQAKAAIIGGSFYASIHLAHHFFLVDNEIIRPVYIQSRIVADMFKGGWAATWESTGGPTQWSGYQGFTVDGNMTQKLMLTYIAAGLKGIGFWTWNSRDAGWEAGEYALTDLQGQPTERARIAGKISERLQKYRFELWEALDEPVVGVLYSWENEAVLGRLSLGTYQLSTPVFRTDHDAQFRQYHVQARVGISRALINGNIPFEYVTERDIEAGLASRYKVIYLPCVVALKDVTLEHLANFVNKGGHLVADMPLLFF